MESFISSVSPLTILIIAAVLGFAATALAVLGGGELVAKRLEKQKGVYESMVGEEIYRLFLPISPELFFIYHVFGIFFCTVLGAVLADPSWTVGGIIGFVIGFFAPRLYLKWAWKQRLKMIDEQVEEAMIYMANSFKANPSLPDAFQDIVVSMSPPITQEVEVMLKEYKLGTALDVALIHLQQRIPSKNLQLAIAALLIGRSVGGNIPFILEEIASTIRESYRLERMIDAQTAQGKMQAWVMGLAPLLVVTVFYYMDPTLIQPLFDSLVGSMILGVAAFLNVAGVVMILKVVSIRV